MLLTAALDLSAPVDVYSEWVDACDAVAKETRAVEASRPKQAANPSRRAERDEGDLSGDDGYRGHAVADDDEDDY